MTTTDTNDSESGLLDETYIRLRATGPEFHGWLSNHGPMAADALIRLGHGDEVESWIDQYSRRLEDAPASRWEINQDEWREALGDPSRLGDWIAFFDQQLCEEPWRVVLVRWWPLLIDGAVAAATHGLIRTGHAVRALLEAPSPAREAELAQALGYWAARHQRLPDHPRPHGTAGPGTALEAVRAICATGGIGARLDDLAQNPAWPASVARLQPVASPAQVPEALNALVDAAVTSYEHWAHDNPIMLVHAATAPRAASLVLPALPQSLWVPTFEAAWATSAAISTIYRPSSPFPPVNRDLQQSATPDEVTERAVHTGDEHAIKFVEVAQESHRRGNPHALPAGARASGLIAAMDENN